MPAWTKSAKKISWLICSQLTFLPSWTVDRQYHINYHSFVGQDVKIISSSYSFHVPNPNTRRKVTSVVLSQWGVCVLHIRGVYSRKTLIQVKNSITTDLKLNFNIFNRILGCLLPNAFSDIKSCLHWFCWLHNQIRELETSVQRFIKQAEQVDKTLAVKPRAHMLLQLMIQRGDLGLLSFYVSTVSKPVNGVIRLTNVTSNRQAPSGDIAHAFANFEELTFILDGGSWGHRHQDVLTIQSFN